MKFELASPSFGEGETIPKQHTGDGKDLSPALEWSDPPSGVKSFALICEDPDAPRGMWVHWLIFNLPPETRKLAEGVPAKDVLPNQAKQGRNDFQKIGYGGPSPPPGKPHRYYFKLYALNKSLDLLAGTTRDKLLAAMKGYILSETQLMGTYGR